MKNKLFLFAMSMISLLSPVKPMVCIAILFIWLDLFFGIWRAVHLGGWKSIRSRRMSSTISKSLLYAGGIVVIFMLEKFVIADIIGMFISVDLVLTKAFTFFCVMVEIKSINESYLDITGKDIFQSFKKFLTRSKQSFDEFK